MKEASDKYRLALINLPAPVMLFNREGQLEFMNQAAKDCLSKVGCPLGPSELPPWLAAEIQSFAAAPLTETGVEKKLDNPGGCTYYHINLRKNEDGGILLTVSDLSNVRFTEDCLRKMVHGLSEATGKAFFRFLVQHLAKSLGADYAFICEHCEQNREWVKTVAVYADGALLENFTFELANTPCEVVVNTRGVCCYPRGLREVFPLDHLVLELDVESYVGVPLIDSAGNVLGPMAVFSRQPIRNRQLAESMLQIFAARATAELERKHAEEVLMETKGRLKTIVDSVQTGIILIEAESRRIVDANDVAASMVGVPKYRLMGATCHNTICPQPPGRCPVIDQDQPIENQEELLLTAGGVRLPVIKNVATVMLNGRKHLLESFIDIFDRKQAEIEIQTLAFYDTLTGLPNRTFLQDRLGKTLIGRPASRPFAVMFLDLDRFKDINDTLGHIFGDSMLKEIAGRLTACVRKHDTVLRLGGDEFVVVLPDMDNERDIAKVARKILNVLSEPILLDEHEIFTTGSIGIALYPADGQDMDALLKHADTAMYRAKDQGRNNFQFFSREMNLQAVEQRQLETSLRHALGNNELFLLYQPQMEILTGRIVGVEALLRWYHPEQGILLPNTFISLAEKTGLIIPIGEWVLRTACKQGQAWHEAGYPPLRIAVNLSGRQLKQYNLIGIVDEILAETGFDPASLELELTESTLMENAESTVHTLKSLRNMGINLAIDDFGTGYSSLSHLKQFPIDRLKIDRSFVRDITVDADDAAIAEAIIAMAHSLKLKVVAEGIERQDQLDFLASRQCDEMQGLLLSAPLSAEEITRYLAGSPSENSFSLASPSRRSP